MDTPKVNTPNAADSLFPLAPEVAGGYERNFIQQAVCELRFPTLMSLGESKPPAPFVSALRKRFPIIETLNEMTVVPGEKSISGHSHQLMTTKQTWIVRLKENAISIETSRYTAFSEFRDQVKEVVSAAIPVIDSDFFTRIGLRYINIVKTDQTHITEWINPKLIGPLDHQGFTLISEYTGRLAMGADDGGCLLQHGMRNKPGINTPTDVTPDYLIDVDAYRTEVPATSVESALNSIHRQGFSLFRWALGPKAIEYLERKERLKRENDNA